MPTQFHVTLDLAAIIGSPAGVTPERQPWSRQRLLEVLAVVDPQARLHTHGWLLTQAAIKRAQGREVWSCMGCTNVKPDGRCGGHQVYLKTT